MRALYVLGYMVLVFTKPAFAQPLLKKVGVIEKKVILHEIREASLKPNNRVNNPKSITYLDAEGNILKRIVYKSNVYGTEKEVRYIQTFDYENGNLVRENIFKRDYNQNFNITHRTDYTYDSKGRRLTETRHEIREDSTEIYRANPSIAECRYAKYEYLENPKRIKFIYTPNFYYLTTYDTVGRAVSQQQMVDEKVRWELTVTYEKDRHIEDYKVYYSQGSNRREIVKYSKLEGSTEERERIYLEYDRSNEKVKYLYNKHGFLIRVERYYFDDKSKKYVLEQFEDIKIKIPSKIIITNELLKRLN